MAPNNPLPVHGNEKTMNLNHLILTNIQSSPYFKVNLYELKTYHEVIDEIYYKVSHLEPWEKGSRKTAGQTGMCGGVRGVGAGGIVSSAYCLLYKLFTLKLTRKQLMGLLTHNDSAYIRGLGFMYIRYTQPPADLWDWYSEYLEDEEELDVRAGGGHVMCIGEMIRLWMTKLEWYSTLFPRIPVPIQKMIEGHLKGYDAEKCNTEFGEAATGNTIPPGGPTSMEDEEFGHNPRVTNIRESPPSRKSPANDHPRSARPSPPFNIAQEMDRDGHAPQRKEKKPRSRSKSRERHRHRSRSRERERRRRSRSKSPKDRHRHKRSRSRERKKRSKSPRERERKHRSRSRSKDRKKHKHRSRSRERGHHHEKDRHHDKEKDRHKGSRESSFERDLRREKERVRKDKYND